MIDAEKWVYRIGVICSFLGIIFAFIKNSPFFGLFDAGMGAWFTKCLAEMKTETGGKRKK